MTDHLWRNSGVRRKEDTGARHEKVTLYECAVCGIKLTVRDCELAIEAAQSKQIELDCDVVVVKEIISL